MLSIIKAIIGIAGLGYTLFYFIPGVMGNDKKLKTAAIIFGSTFLVLLLISGLEMYF